MTIIPPGFRLLREGERARGSTDYTIRGRDGASALSSWQKINGFEGRLANANGFLMGDGWPCIRPATKPEPAQEKEWMNPWD